MHYYLQKNEISLKNKFITKNDIEYGQYSMAELFSAQPKRW
jgi:hypothetical protein